MSKVQSISGASATEIQQLADKAKEMGAKTKFSATESAELSSTWRWPDGKPPTCWMVSKVS